MSAFGSLLCSRPMACPNSWLATARNEISCVLRGGPIVQVSSESNWICPAHGLEGGQVSPSTLYGPSIDANWISRSDCPDDTSVNRSGVTADHAWKAWATTVRTFCALKPGCVLTSRYVTLVWLSGWVS